MKEILEERFHSGNLLPSHDRWWKLVLTGVLVFVFGIAAILLPASVVMIRILDVVFGLAKPQSGSMTAIAALLALVALVAIDGLLNPFHAGVMEEKRRSRIRGVIGIAVAVAAAGWTRPSFSRVANERHLPKKNSKVSAQPLDPALAFASSK